MNKNIEAGMNCMAAVGITELRSLKAGKLYKFNLRKKIQISRYNGNKKNANCIYVQQIYSNKLMFYGIAMYHNGIASHFLEPTVIK